MDIRKKYLKKSVDCPKRTRELDKGVLVPTKAGNRNRSGPRKTEKGGEKR
jgi:hypothetical protein